MGGGHVPEELLAQLHPLEVKVVPHLKDGLSVSDLARASGLQDVEAMRACQWLENKGALKLEPLTTQQYLLGSNAEKALKRGLPEQRFLDTVRKGAKTTEAIAKNADLDSEELGVSIGILKRKGLITVEKNAVALTKNGKREQQWPELDLLRALQKRQPAKKEEPLIKDLQRRKEYLIIKEKRDRKITLTTMGKELAKVKLSKLKYEDRLTAEDLKTGAWKEKEYRAYDVAINVPHIPGGKIHFVQEAINYIRRIWVEMGFEEMEGSLVQNAFWDLDALFVPQDHPARELQDTFYIDASGRPIDKTAFERVRAVHEHGGQTGSKGWQSPFERQTSEQLLLRTHNTVLSAQTLWKIRMGEAKMPGKYFSVGKVFRNEKLDWKHLFEFTQVEGIVVDKNVTLAHLLGYLKIFFEKMGYPDVRARPSHFPYTEPSCEIDVWHPKKKQWIELGGSGIFRPEVTKTLIGEEVPVLAWGLGLERIIVDYFGFTDLRDLYKNDVKQLRDMKRFVRIPA